MKHTKITVFFAALVCVVMLLSSCIGSATLPAEGEQLKNDPITNESIGEAVSNIIAGGLVIPKLDSDTSAAEALDFDEALAVWKSYLSYNGESSQHSWDADEINLENYEIDGKLLLIEKTKIYNEDTEEEYEETWTEVYNLNKGFDAPVVSTPAVKQGGTDPVAAYEVSTNSAFNYINVKTTMPVPVYEELPEGETLPEGEEPEIVGYEYEYIDTYYNANGEKIAEFDNWEDASLSREYEDGYRILSIGDKSYAMSYDGELLKTFTRGLEYPLPVDYDFEYNGYKYWVEYDSVLVMNSDFELVVSYNGDFEYVYLLGNGNLFLQSEIYLPEAASNYDYNYYGNKVDVKHVVIDVATGKVSEPELGFVVNALQSESENSNISIKDSLNIANVQRYENGELSVASENLVLKNDMSTEASLPDLVLNQSGMLLCVAENTYLLETALGDYEVSYVVDNGRLELMPNNNYSSSGPAFSFHGDIYSWNLNTRFENATVYELFDGGRSFVARINDDGEYIWRVFYTTTGGGLSSAKIAEPTNIYNVDIVDDKLVQVYTYSDYDEEYYYCYYGSDGDFLFSSEYSATLVYSSESVWLFETDDGSYYLVR